MRKQGPLVLVIIDGWGIAPAGPGNAISLAKTPTYNKFLDRYPTTKLKADGQAVGLPPGQIGNSESGHMNIGAGRTIVQDSVKILQSIDDRSFYKNPTLLRAINSAKKRKTKLHLMGILSNDQCPHMHPRHLLALLDLCERENFKDVVLHLFTDGRDSSPNSALEHWDLIKSGLPKQAKVGSVCGRLYLDRKKKWSRTKEVYEVLTEGKAKFSSPTFEEAIKSAYARGETDEFISPTIINSSEETRIKDQDSVIFFNLRSDRARQLTMAFALADFKGFRRRKFLSSLVFVALTDFGPVNVLTAFPSEEISSTLPMTLLSLRQLYIAETEKYAHVTYFFNGGYESPVAGESRILVNSPDVKKYDETPKMSLEGIVQVIFKSLQNDLYDVVVVNFANPDMMGHTGNLKAAVKACEMVDWGLSELYKIVIKKKGILLITADHGNAESMSPDGAHTNHTSSPVPFILVSSGFRAGATNLRSGMSVTSVAPTVVDLLGLPMPREMISPSLIDY